MSKPTYPILLYVTFLFLLVIVGALFAFRFQDISFFSTNTVASALSIAHAQVPQASAFPDWSSIITIYYNPSQEDANNLFLQQASTVLKTYLEEISPETFTIETVSSPAQGIFLVVNSDHAQLQNKNSEAFYLFADSRGVHIIGKTPIAIRHGAYMLLEKLGFRWYFKHPVWKIKPKSLSSLDNLKEVREPHYVWRRYFQGGAKGLEKEKEVAWQKWNRLGGAKAFDSGHNYFDIIPKRDPDAPTDVYCPNADSPRQLRPDHPYVIQQATEYVMERLAGRRLPPITLDSILRAASPVTPNDGLSGWCPDYNGDAQIITNKVFGLANNVAREISSQFPDRYVSVQSYSTYNVIPEIQQLHPNLLVLVTGDRTSFNSLDSVNKRIKAFEEKGADTGVYEYYDVSVWDRDIPPNYEVQQGFYQLLNGISVFADSGAIAYTMEASDGWGAKGLLYYAASKLLWDPDANLEQVMDDFYLKAFGPAKVPMKDYYNWLNSDPTQNERSIAEAYRYLDEADRLANGDEEILERVRHAQYYVRFLWLRKVKQTGDSLQDSINLYKFIHRIRDTFVVYHYYRERELKATLEAGGLSSDEIANLQRTDLPTPQEARAWMDEAILALSHIDVHSPSIDVRNMQFEAFGASSQEKYPPLRIRQRTILIPAQAGTSVTVDGWYKKSLIWMDSKGNVLDARFSDSTINGTFEFFAPVSDTYKLQMWGEVDVVGSPAAYYVGSDDGGSSRWFEERGGGYFYVPPNTKAFTIGVENTNKKANPSITVYSPSGKNSLERMCSNSDPNFCEWSVQDPDSGLWRLEFSTSFPFDLWILGIPPLLWHDPELLLKPANNSLSSPTPTPPPPSPIPDPTSFNQLHLFLDRIESITLLGSGLTGDFKVVFKDTTGTKRLTFSSITGATASLTLDFTTKDLSSVPSGSYAVEVTRLSDNLTKTHPKTFIITRLGDLWSSAATDSSEQKRDGKVDVFDVSRLLSKWHSTDLQDLLEADINSGPNNISQGKIDLFDANRLMANWSQ